MATQEWLEGWEKLIEQALEGQKTRSPEMAREMQQFLEEKEAEAEAKGTPIPKHSHRFAPENLWPDKDEQH